MSVSSSLQKMVLEYSDRYGHRLTLQMLVRAIETFEEQGGFDPSHGIKLPRAGNWSGQYTHLWEPIRISLKLPSWRDLYEPKA